MRSVLSIGLTAALLAGSAGCMDKDKETGGVDKGSAVVSPTLAPTPASTPTASVSAAPQATAKSAVSAAPQPSAEPQPPASTASEADAKQAIASRAAETVQALKAKDMAKLAELVHPEKGVQFSPYSYIDTQKDVRVEQSKLQAQWQDGTALTWGNYDGSGEPIAMSMQQYFDKFVYNQDYAAAPEVGYNRIIGKGNMVNNLFEIYPKDKFITVEYHFKGIDPQFEGNDWCSLRLVFENYKQQWLLVGAIHDQHTM